MDSPQRRSPRRSMSPDERDSHRDRSRSPVAAPPPASAPAHESRHVDDDVNPNPGNNLFVTGLSIRCKDEDLNNLFEKFGKLTKAAIMYDPHTRESRGFGFVTFVDSEDAEKAIANVTGTEFMGRILTVEKAKRATARNPTPGRYYGPAKTMPPRRFGGDNYGSRYEPRGRDNYQMDRGYDRGGYDRGGGGGGGGYDRGYDRGGYDRPPYGGGGDRGYDRPPYGGDRDRDRRPPRYDDRRPPPRY